MRRIERAHPPPPPPKKKKKKKEEEKELQLDTTQNYIQDSAR
jgi:hypothetical protein